MSAVMKAQLYEEDLYAELEALPERLTGEIINGRLYAQPR
ncbi:MAG: Uma2 protein, partial [Pseudomonadota bacterium]|nr:Uma2 protein [Pseudomonadota bacterium]